MYIRLQIKINVHMERYGQVLLIAIPGFLG